MAVPAAPRISMGDPWRWVLTKNPEMGIVVCHQLAGTSFAIASPEMNRTVKMGAGRRR